MTIFPSRLPSVGRRADRDRSPPHPCNRTCDHRNPLKAFTASEDRHKDPDEKAGLKEFDSLFFRHVGYTISNFVRTLSLGLSGARLAHAPVSGPTAKYYRNLTRMSSALALVSDIAMMLLGGGLKRKERLSARLGDVLSNLYLGCAVLKYYRDNGSQPDDLPYVHWNLQTALYNCQVALKEFFENLPNRPVAWLLRLIVFPFGSAYRLPDDRLEHQIVQTMFTDNELRTRLTSLTYIGDRDEDPAFGKTGVPFGPFIALAAVEYLFIGAWAEQWFMGGAL